MRIVFQNPWVRAGGVLALGVLLVLLASLLSEVLVPLFFAFIVAYAFDPVMDLFERWRVPRMLAIVGLMLVLFAAMLSLPLFIVPGLVTEGEKLADRAKAGLQQGWLDKMIDRLPLDQVLDQLDELKKMPQAVEAAPATREQELIRKMVRAQAVRHDPALDPALPPSAAPAAAVPVGSDIAANGPPVEVTEKGPESRRAELLRSIAEVIKLNATTFIVSNISEIAGAGQEVGSRAAGVVGSVLSIIIGFAVFAGNLALFLFVTVYLLHDYDHIVRACDDFVPPRYRDRVRRFMHRVDLQLRAFFRGQGMVCICLGTMYGIGMLISDVPFAIPLAIFGGVASFVPYLGLALTIGPAALLTLLVHGADWHVVGVILTFSIANFLEGNFITPAIVGKQVGLAPVWVILAIMVFGSTLGFLGLLIAVPVAAVLKVVIEELVAAYRASSFFSGPLAVVSTAPDVAGVPSDVAASPEVADVSLPPRVKRR